MKLKSHTVRILTAAILSLTLGGCVSAVIGSAAVGTKAVIDRRTTGAQTDDNVMALRIETTARSYLRQNNQVQGYTPKISVVGYNRHLLLLGQVATEGEKQFVGQIARSEQAAEDVYNYITVASQPRSLGDITNDTWNTSKVRAALLGIAPATQARVKIVTYDNVTYIMGILTPDEQAQVTQKVSTTVGVQKVVTLYQNYVQR
ncbi:TPA: BON domain-containing protein [Neisseria cinerea]|jgi:phospholipid-binding domain protein